MMTYSKMFGTLIGGALSVLVSKYGLPTELTSPEIVGALTTLVCAIGTYLAPANKVS